MKFSECVKGFSSNKEWALYLKKNLPCLVAAVNSGKSFSALRSVLEAEKGSTLTISKRQKEIWVKAQYKNFSIRYFFRRGKISGKKSSDFLYKIEFILPQENEKTFIKENSSLFAGIKGRDFIFEVGNSVWFCECRMKSLVFQHQEKGVYYTLFSPGRIVKFEPLTVDSPKYAVWLEKIKEMANPQGYIELKTPGQVDYYRPEECSKWFRVLPQNQEKIKEAICTSDEAAGKLVLSKYDLLK